MVTSQIFDHGARLRSFEITAQARDALSLEPATDRGCSKRREGPASKVLYP
jgi:hypothetical protein